VVARPCRAGREAAGLEGVSPALRAWASDFGKTQSHQRSSPPLIRPTYVGFLRLTRLSDGTRRRAVHGPAPLARHPVSRPGQAGSPLRIRGGTKIVPTSLLESDAPLAIMGAASDSILTVEMRCMFLY
jgi:hypothetical protein